MKGRKALTFLLGLTLLGGCTKKENLIEQSIARYDTTPISRTFVEPDSAQQYNSLERKLYSGIDSTKISASNYDLNGERDFKKIYSIADSLSNFAKDPQKNYFKLVGTYINLLTNAGYKYGDDFKIFYARDIEGVARGPFLEYGKEYFSLRNLTEKLDKGDKKIYLGEKNKK